MHPFTSASTCKQGNTWIKVACMNVFVAGLMKPPLALVLPYWQVWFCNNLSNMPDL